LANPAAPGIGTDPALNPPPSVTAEEKAPALKPVYPATDWSPPTKRSTAPVSSKKLAASKLAASKLAASKLSASKHTASKHTASKHGKKIKASAKKPTKAECKKFAKEAKKHKKELAICKAERKKALLKAKAKKTHD
jgi:hypothetical protein